VDEKFWIGFSNVSTIELKTFPQNAIQFIQKSDFIRTFLVFSHQQYGPTAYLVDDNNFLRRPLDEVTNESECIFYEVSTCRANRLLDKCEAAINHLSLAKPIKGWVETNINRLVNRLHKGEMPVSFVQPYHIFNCLLSAEYVVKLCREANIEVFPKWLTPPMWPSLIKAFLDNDPASFKPRKIIRSVVSL